MLMGCDSVWPAGAPVADRPNRSLFTAPSIWMLLYRLFLPATERAPGSELTAIGEKYGDVRAKSSRLRDTVGRFSSCSVETFAAGPVREALMTGSSSASTVTVSLTLARGSLKSIATVSPSGTITLTCSWLRKPESVAVTVYGPPTRTLEMKKRPSASVIDEYGVPVGPCTASIVTPGRTASCWSTATPLIEPDVTFWANAGVATPMAAAYAIATRIALSVNFI